MRRISLFVLGVAAAASALAFDPITDDSGVYVVTWDRGTIPIVNNLPTDVVFIDGSTFRSSYNASLARWNEILGNVQFSDAEKSAEKGQVKNVLESEVMLCLGLGLMRAPRIKVDAGEGSAVYHVMTRTVNGEHLLDDVAKEVLRKQLWQIADYCGVQICTFALMSNHFHVLLRVPKASEVSDAELLRRYGILYPKPTKYQTARLEVIKAQLVGMGPDAIEWRQKQLALMGDVSQFMKLLKQRFSVWFNRSHGRYGTLWSERFKSVLVEGKAGIMRTMAAYIDLNPVRAGLCADPKDYRFCGYAEAVAGNLMAQRGVAQLFEGVEAKTWRATQGAYRQMLFGTAAGPRELGHQVDFESFQEVVKQGGKLPLATVLRCRVRHFSDGAVLGSRAFVTEHLAHYRRATGRRERTSPREVPGVADWGDLATLRGLRKQSFG